MAICWNPLRALSTFSFFLLDYSENLKDWAISREVANLGDSSCKKICNPSTTTRQHPGAKKIVFFMLDEYIV